MTWKTCHLMNVLLPLEKKDILHLRWLDDWKSSHVYVFRIRKPKPPTAILRVADNPIRRGPRFVAARRDFGDDPLQREVFSDVPRGCICTLTARSMCMRVIVSIVYEEEAVYEKSGCVGAITG